MESMQKNLLLKVTSVITDAVTTTDELIPSGETSSYRSNPLKLAEFTLSRKDPNYVMRAKKVQSYEKERQDFICEGKSKEIPEDLISVYSKVNCNNYFESIEDMLKTTEIGSVLLSVKPGDGSAREQAASCQRVLGGLANIAVEYATKRYRSNLINWGLLPFTIDKSLLDRFEADDWIFIPDIRRKIADGEDLMKAMIIGEKGTRDEELFLKNLTGTERNIILKGCLINFYKV
jgi:aconitate hydratase